MKEPPPEATNQRKLFIEIQNISFHFYKIMFFETHVPFAETIHFQVILMISLKLII